MKKLLICFLSILIISCKKDKNPPANGTSVGYKIDIVKGNNQTDTLGNMLKDTIIISATKDGKPINKALIRFETTGCDESVVNQVFIINNQASYQWQLSGPLGKEALKVVLLDSLNIRRDSVNVNATEITPTHGWHRSACTPPGNPIPNSFCKLASGRLLVCFNSFDYPFYSDDNALTWHQLKSFPLGADYQTIDKLIVTSDGELFAATQNNGLYYSPDGGSTWSLRNEGIIDPRYFVDMNYTKSGRLLYSTYFGGIYLSTDKGNTWTAINNGLSNSDRFYYPSEDNAGNLYVVSDVGAVEKSSNGGVQWSSSSFGLNSIQSIFIDNNGDMYLGAATNTSALYKITNSTPQLLYTTPYITGAYTEVQHMSNQNGAYYFYTYGNGLVKTTDFVNYVNIAPSLTETSRCYITDKNANLIIGTAFNGIYFNRP